MPAPPTASITAKKDESIPPNLSGHERQMERLNRLYSSLSQINRAIARTVARDDLFQQVCRILCQQGGFRMAWIGWYAPETRVLTPMAACGDDEACLQGLVIRPDDLVEGQSQAATAFREGRPCICNDLLTAPQAHPWRSEIKRHDLRASATFPVQRQSAGCGTLTVYADEPGFFRDKEIALLAEAAVDLSFAVDRFACEEERCRAEEEIKRYKAIFDSTDYAIIAQTLEGIVTHWNRAAERIFGYQSSEAVGKPVAMLFPPLRLHEGVEILDRIRRGERIEHFETIRRCKDGRQIPVSVAVSPIYSLAGAAGGAARITGASEIVRDLSDRQNARAVAEREQLFSQAMIESMPGILYFYDERGRFLRWNQNFVSVSGYTADEIAEMHPLDFFPEQEKPLLAEKISEVFRIGESSVEASFVAKDRSTVPYFFTGKRICFDGKICLVGMGIDISERKQAEAALKKSEHRYRTTLDGILEGCQLIGFDWHYLYLNQAAAGHNRRPNHELLGRRMPEMWPGIEASRIFGLLQRCMDERAAFHEATEFVFLDGAKGWFDVRAQPVPEGVFVLSIDITERKHAEDRLAESERNYRELVESANSIILRWNAAGQITFLNDFGLRFFGYQAHEILGRHVMETIVPPADRDGRDLGQLMQQICADPKAFEQNINENIRRNGERAWIAWTNRIVRDAQGGVVEILSVGADITEQRRAAEAIRELNTTLERRVEERTAELAVARDRAEAADRLKSAFLATMSHELRTPLNSIIGFTGTVLQGLAGPVSPEQSKQLGMVRGSARHLLELINDVLDISKIEAGQLEVRSERFDLTESVQRVIASVGPGAEKRGLALQVVLPPPPLLLVSDRRRVEQILLNLLSNAIKFTERGVIKLTLEALQNDALSPIDKPRNVIRVKVSDTGIGIRPEDLALLFKPFRQIDTGLTRQHEGTGLGLAICRRLADLLGGEIHAESEWGRGSVFTLILPLEKAGKASS